KAANLTVRMQKGVHEVLSIAPGTLAPRAVTVFDIGMNLRADMLRAGVLGAQSPTIRATPAAAAPAAAAPAGAPGTGSCRQTSVSVEVNDDGYVLSQNSIPCGSVTFHVHSSNSGGHNFAIAELSAETPALYPGQSYALHVYLEPGTGVYTYYDSIGGGADNMRGTFTVSG